VPGCPAHAGKVGWFLRHQCPAQFFVLQFVNAELVNITPITRVYDRYLSDIYIIHGVFQGIGPLGGGLTEWFVVHGGGLLAFEWLISSPPNWMVQCKRRPACAKDAD